MSVPSLTGCTEWAWLMRQTWSTSVTAFTVTTSGPMAESIRDGCESSITRVLPTGTVGVPAGS
jgi:hypothetical protein